MAHEIDMTTGRAAMAYTGETPWHGLGQKLPEGAPIEEWRIAAGMDWEARTAEVLFRAEDDGVVRAFNDRRVVYRSDTLAPLGVVSDRYRVVQPGDVLEFFRDLVAAGGFQLETAGCLFGGRRFWALANTQREMTFGGADTVRTYLLLSTSVDGTLATQAQFTTIRVVCNNTLSMAALHPDKGVPLIRVPHSTTFDPDEVKAELGILDEEVEGANSTIEKLIRKKVDRETAANIIARAVLDDEEVTYEEMTEGKRVTAQILEFLDTAPGNNMKTARETAWGAVNAVTYWADHARKTRSIDRRLESAWWGDSERIKQNVVHYAIAA